MGATVKKAETGIETEKTKEQTPVKELTCNECYLWIPTKKAWKCELSGKKKLATMFACQFIKSRRVTPSVV